MVKNRPASAGETGLIPGPGRSHVPRSSSASTPQLLSPCSRARELQLLKAECPRARAPQQEKPEHHNEEEPPPTSTRGSLREAIAVAAQRSKNK